MSLYKNLKKLDDLNDTDLARQDNIHKLIIGAGIEQFRVESIPGDASNREYYRIHTLNNTYILMDDSADFDSLQPFINIDNLLLTHGIRAPIIIASNVQNGLLLLEDFGNNSFNNYLANDPNSEQRLYNSAIDVLVKIYSMGSEIKLPVQNVALLNKGINSFLEFYVKDRIPSTSYSRAANELYKIFEGYYPKLKNLRPVLVLRDYMADNLFWLNQDGLQGVGLIDFQDAVIGSPAYDMVSLLEDARRDVSPSVVKEAKKRYLDKISEISGVNFEESYAILSAQRNLRIIGVFHKLVNIMGKPKYATYYPRIWRYIDNNLENPQMAELKNWFEAYDVFDK